jgi:hypothetical protein
MTRRIAHAENNQVCPAFFSYSKNPVGWLSILHNSLWAALKIGAV